MAQRGSHKKPHHEALKDLYTEFVNQITIDDCLPGLVEKRIISSRQMAQIKREITNNAPQNANELLLQFMTMDPSEVNFLNFIKILEDGVPSKNMLADHLKAKYLEHVQVHQGEIDTQVREEITNSSHECTVTEETRPKQVAVNHVNTQPNERDRTQQTGDNAEVEKDEFHRRLSGYIVSSPNVQWDDVVGLKEAKDALKEAVVLPIKFPQFFTGKRKPWKGILLYGPPGTGKSHLAKAVATEVKDATFISISPADIISKWQGESEKLVKSLFELARKKKPSIIFIDEIDSLCSNRTDEDSESMRRIKTEFLTQLDGVGKDSEGILFLGATNLPWVVDYAIRRRMEKRIYIPLPEMEDRAQIFRIEMGDTPCELTNEDYTELGRQTKGYTGSDISVIVREASLQPLRVAQDATHFKKVRVSGDQSSSIKELWTPCPADDGDAVKMNLMDIDGSQLMGAKVTMDDMLAAVNKQKPSVTEADLQKLQTFLQDIGINS